MKLQTQSIRANFGLRLVKPETSRKVRIQYVNDDESSLMIKCDISIIFWTIFDLFSGYFRAIFGLFPGFNVRQPYFNPLEPPFCSNEFFADFNKLHPQFCNKPKYNPLAQSYSFASLHRSATCYMHTTSTPFTAANTYSFIFCNIACYLPSPICLAPRTSHIADKLN